MTVANIISLGCGEYEEFVFVLFPPILATIHIFPISKKRAFFQLAKRHAHIL